MKKDSAIRISSVVKQKEKTGKSNGFESQFIFKLASIVFDSGSSAELLRYQIQVFHHAEKCS